MRGNVPFESACKNFEEDLVLYYYGEINDAEKHRIEQHLSGCQSCGRFVGDLRRLLPQMMKSEEFPPSFWDSYYHETLAKLAQQEERKYWWKNLFAPMKMWMLPAFGTVAIAVLAIGLIFGKGDSTRLTERSSDAIPQEIVADASQLEFFESLDMFVWLSKVKEQDEQKADPKANQSSSWRMETQGV
jgi:predicted anti-sigma-YlaC factor YlaD